eukprot:20704-Eustigmatos_ZCMA.PRE.1
MRTRSIPRQRHRSAAPAEIRRCGERRWSNRSRCRQTRSAALPGTTRTQQNRVTRCCHCSRGPATHRRRSAWTACADNPRQ